MSRVSHYVHGSDEAEQRRLTTLNAWINERLLPEMRLNGGERIVDFGAGLGQFTRLLARAAGGSRPVVGIERDPEQIAEAMRQSREAGEGHLLDLRLGDVIDAPPLAAREWGTFDLAHARFILEHVPDPLAVVKNMVRAVRAGGGRIVLADDDHEIMRLWPEVPEFDRAWRAYQQTYAAAGNDPVIGRRLVELLHAAGARPVRNTWVFFGACTGEAIWRTVIENIIVILRGARESMLRLPDARDSMIDEAIAAITKWSMRPEAALWYAIALAEGIKP